MRKNTVIALMQIQAFFVGTQLLQPDLALGQTRAAVSSGTGLEEIVVTARRVEEKIQDVPVAVTAFSSENLRSLAVTSVSDLSILVPGLRFNNLHSQNNLSLMIRGQQNQQPTAGQDVSIGLYIAGIPTNLIEGNNLSMFDIGDVQVLKGPQGTLFGRNTTGGAILINPVKPTDTFGGYLQIGGTAYDEIGTGGFRSDAVINVPVSNKLALRFSAHAETADGFVANIIPPNQVHYAYPPVPGSGSPITDFGPRGEIEHESWRLSAVWRPTDDIQNYFMYEGKRANDDGPQYGLESVFPTSTAGSIYNGKPSRVFGGADAPSLVASGALAAAARSSYFWVTQDGFADFERINGAIISNTTTWDIGNITLKNIGGYYLSREDQLSNYDALPYSLLDLNFGTGGRDFSDEFQVLGHAFNDSLNWVAGVFYFNEHSYFTTVSEIFDSVKGSVDANSFSQSYSGFGQGTWKIPYIDGLSLSAGFRFTVDDRQLNSLQTSNVGVCAALTPQGKPLPLADCRLSGRRSFNAPTYTVSVDYKLDPSTLIYAASRRGYRSGGFQRLTAGLTSLSSFEPETVNDYEIGVKKDWEIDDHAARTNIALYHQDYTDIQELYKDPSNVTAQKILNVAAATIEGAEIEATVVPCQGVTLSAFAGLIYPKFTNFANQANIYLADHHFVLVPQQQYSGTLTYRLPFDQRIGEVTLTGNYYWQANSRYDQIAQLSPQQGPSNVLIRPSYGMLNFNGNWEGVYGSQFDLSFFVKNAMDTKTYSWGAAGSTSSIGINTGLLLPPRQIGVSVRYNFGD